MSVIFDLLYRDYCLARLAEMRKPHLAAIAGDEIPEVNWDAGDPSGLGDRDSGFCERATTKETPSI